MSASEKHVKRRITRIQERFSSLIIKNSFTALYMARLFVILKTKLCPKVSRHPNIGVERFQKKPKVFLNFD